MRKEFRYDIQRLQSTIQRSAARTTLGAWLLNSVLFYPHGTGFYIPCVVDCVILYLEDMKTLLIAIFVVAELSAQGQNVGYLSLSPEDRAIGIRSDIGHVYVSMSYGNYYLPFGGYIKDHSRIGIGLIYSHYSIGMVYHSYGEVYEALPLNKASLRPVSIEAGVRVFVTERFVAALRYDVLRREGTVDFGFCFGK